MPRVVVTGLGAVTPIGIGYEAFWESLIAGKSGIDKVKCMDVSAFSAQIAAEVSDFDPTKYLDRKQSKRLVRFIQFAIAAAQMGLADAGIKFPMENGERTGVFVGSGIGGIKFLEDQARVLFEKGPSRLSPFTVPFMICDMAAGYVSINVGAKGPNSCIVTACASGTNNIGESYKLLQRGDADVMITGGTEAAITPMGLGSFCAAKALTSYYNDNPTKASRPFDAKRSGFVMGEGAGILILETLEHAQKRGARIHAEVIGYGMSGDAHHITAPAPGGDGAVRSIRACLKDANITPDQVDYVNAHGTSTQLNDKFESMALKTVFGERAYKLPISSNKSMIGHLLGAAGGVEAVASVLTVKNDLIPPTMNHEEKDPDCDLDYVPNQARKQKVDIAISESFGFGGHNAILAFKKYVP